MTWESAGRGPRSRLPRPPPARGGLGACDRRGQLPSYLASCPMLHPNPTAQYWAATQLPNHWAAGLAYHTFLGHCTQAVGCGAGPGRAALHAGRLRVCERRGQCPSLCPALASAPRRAWSSLVSLVNGHATAAPTNSFWTLLDNSFFPSSELFFSPLFSRAGASATPWCATPRRCWAARGRTRASSSAGTTPWRRTRTRCALRQARRAGHAALGMLRWAGCG